MIGRTLNHYRIEAKLGAGGMGEVYVARDTRLNREVALKVLPAELAADAQYRGRFQREAEAVAALNHPGIVTIHSVEEADGIHFLTMELVDGKSLDQLIPEGGLDVGRFFDVAVQVVEALAAAHERGITHRDLKPQNIVVTDDWRVKVLDFGLAKIDGGALDDVSDQETAAPLTQRGALMGTIGYMSPEQATGGAVDRRSDLFSLGVILYEMATGRRPFAGDSSAEQLTSLLRDEPRPISQIDATLPPAAASIIERCLAKSPAERTPGATELRVALLEARQAPAGLVAGGGRGRPRWLLPAVVAVAGVGLIAVFLLGRGGDVGGVASGPDAGVALAPPAPPAPPGAPAAAGIGASGRPAIAVMRFELHGAGDDQRWLSGGAADMLVTGLAQTRGLDVIGSDRLRAAAQQLGEAGLDSLERGRFGQVARHAGAGAMVLGSIFALGQSFRIDVRVEDLGSGRVLSAASVSGEELFPLIDELTGKVRTSLSVAGEGETVSELTSTSLEAYRRYSEGLEARANMRIADALRLLREAVAIDPAFAKAHFLLSQIESNRDDRKRHVDLVVEHKGNLPERQRLLFEARQASVRKEPQRATEIVEELLNKYPDVADAYTYLANLHGTAGRHDAALAVYQRGVAAMPTSGPMRNNLGYALLRAERYDEAVEAFEEYARLSPREPNPHDSIGEAYLVAEQPRESLVAYARALAIDPTFSNAHLGRIRAFSMLGDYAAALEEVERLGRIPDRVASPIDPYVQQRVTILARLGRYAEADRLLREHVLELGDDAAAAVLCELIRALLALERQDVEAATAAFARTRDLLAGLPEASRLGFGAVLDVLVGAVAARAGDLETARGYAESLAALPAESRGTGVLWDGFLTAEILLAAGELDAAESAFAAAEPESRRTDERGTVFYADWRARLANARGDADAEFGAYRDLLRIGRHRKWTMRLEPRYLLEAVRLLDRAGDKAGARQEAERLAERLAAIWENADDNLPEVIEIRRRLGR